jgi:hypothetical protein
MIDKEKLKKLSWILSELEAKGKISTSASYDELAKFILNILND